MTRPGIDILSVLSRDTNNWVVRVANRQHPGIVIQGDSLKILYDLAEEIRALAGDRSELSDVAEELRDLLRERLVIYEKALREHQLELPYAKPVS